MQMAAPRGGRRKARLQRPGLLGPALLLAVYVAGYASIRFLPQNSSTHHLIANGAFLPLGLLAVLLAARTSRRLGVGTRKGWSWLLLCLGYFAYFLGDLIWLVYDLVLQQSPFPSWADAAYLSVYPLFAVGLLVFSVGRDTGATRLQAVMDTTIIVLAGTVLLWHYAFLPTIRGGGEDPRNLALLLTYPAADLILLSSLALFVLKLNFRRGEPSQLLLLGALLVMLLADVAFGYQSQGGTFVSGGYVDLAYLVQWALLALAAWAGHAEEREEATRYRKPFALVIALPHMLLAAILGLFLADFRSSLHNEGAQLLLGIGLLAPLVGLRRVVLRRETSRLHLERDLLRNENRLRALVEKSSDLILILDESGRINFASPSAREVCRLEIEENLLEHVHPEDHPLAQEGLKQAAASGPEESTTVALRLRDEDGWGEYELILSNYLFEEGIAGLLTYARDIGRHRQLERELSHLALHDALTGLPNRRLFADRVSQAISQGDRAGKPIAVLFIDLDNFKAVNDRLGHGQGDCLLKEVARRLLAELRESDTVARIGGDELAVLLQSQADEEGARLVAERLLAALREPLQLGDELVVTTASIGIAVREPRGVPPAELLRQADVAMYLAKSGGKDTCRLFTPGMVHAGPAAGRTD